MAFGEWNQVQAQQWSEFVWRHLHYAEMSVGCLAFAAGMPVEAAGRLLEGRQQPSVLDCLAVARALGANGSRLLELAGHRASFMGGTYRDFAA